MTMTFISFHIRKFKVILVAFINHSWNIQLTIYNKESGQSEKPPFCGIMHAMFKQIRLNNHHTFIDSYISMVFMLMQNEIN